MSLVNEFKTFALKGNVIHLAVGVITGAAFARIVNSLVSDIIMPPLGLLIGGVDFKEFKLFLGAPFDGQPVYLKYGSFIQACFEFFIMAWAIFFIMKIFNALQEEEKKKTENEREILSEIRDLLRKRAGSDPL